MRAGIVVKRTLDALNRTREAAQVLATRHGLDPLLVEGMVKGHKDPAYSLMFKLEATADLLEAMVEAGPPPALAEETAVAKGPKKGRE